MAELKWFGHACFRLSSRDAKILMDPLPRSTGYRPDRQKVDIVTLSHDDPDHSYLELINTDYKLVDGPGEYEMNDVLIKGVRTFRNHEKTRDGGFNTAYVIHADEITFCHLGDLGHSLSAQQIEDLESIDVLMLPVGGHDTLDAATANELVQQIEPKIVVPMQFRTIAGDHNLDGVDKFLKEMGLADITPRDKLTLKASDLGEGTEVVVLEP